MNSPRILRFKTGWIFRGEWTLTFRWKTGCLFQHRPIGQFECGQHNLVTLSKSLKAVMNTWFRALNGLMVLVSTGMTVTRWLLRQEFVTQCCRSRLDPNRKVQLLHLLFSGHWWWWFKHMHFRPEFIAFKNYINKSQICSELHCHSTWRSYSIRELRFIC